MKKIITILATLMLTTMSINFVKAEGFAVGFNGSFTMIDASGTETVSAGDAGTAQTSAKKAVSNNVFTGSLFGEYSLANVSYADTGVTFGIRYTPGSADVSSKLHSRTDVSTGADVTAEADTGTYKAAAQVENYINYYVDLPVYKNFFVKAGWSQIDVITQESATSTTIGTYGNKTLDGLNYGVGVKGENGNVIWKLAYEITDFDTLNLTSTTSNKIKADLDTSEVNLSVGYKF